MDPQSAIAILGAGYIGQSLAQTLRDQGSKIRMISKSGTWRPHRPQGLDPALASNIDLARFDLVAGPLAQLRQHLHDVSATVACYAPGRQVDPSLRHALYTQTPARVCQALPGPSRIVALSSTSALPDLNCWLDESCALAPTSARGQTAWQAEQAWWQAASEHGHSLVILRVAGIFGPGRPLTSLYGKTGVVPGDAHQYTNLVHRDDILAAIVAALSLPVPQARLVHVCNNDHPTRRDMIRWSAAQLQQKTPQFQAPQPEGPARGKRVASHRLQAPVDAGGLGVVLTHPLHRDPS